MGLFSPDQTAREEKIQARIDALLERLDETIASISLSEAELTSVRTAVGLTDQVTALKEELSQLRIEKAEIEEGFARERREIEHMVGLERIRATEEADAARREAKLSVREENLEQQRAQFDKQMEFQAERFQDMETHLKDLVGQVLNRLPTFQHTVTEHRGTPASTAGELTGGE